MDEINAENAEEYPQPQGERFNDQAPWKRIIVLIAGATMNYLLALVLIVLMFAFLGRPVYKVVEKMEPTDAQIVQNADDLQVGDVIMKIDGKTVYMISDYMDILDGHSQGDILNVTVLRGEEVKEVSLVLKADADIQNLSDTHTLLTAMGVNSMYAVTEKEGFFQTIGHSFAYSVKIGGTVLRSLGELLTGKLGIDAMGGPITTIKVTSEAASSGWMSFLNIAAFIGVNLAVFNLLPIPALDGCKVIFCLIEWIRKKPVNRKVETMIHFIGIIFLFGFAILVDLLQLF
ncbi:MAG: site-2 protease family protein [Clostridia bacterium]|nr:site-2 protease family protein [Clostridia bacterium]